MISSTHDIEPVYAWGSFEIAYGIAQNTIAGLCADAEYFTHLLNAHHIGIVF